MSFINNLENSILDHFVGNTTWTKDATLYIALSTTTPNKTGGNFTEPSGNGYERVAAGAANWNSAATGALDNSAALTFPSASGGNWGTVTYAGIYSAETGGTLRAVGALTTAKAINDGDTAEFAIGDFDISFNQSI